nr:retrovirus-related Pol polyprotein from transposon TNT 1-94 [Tanacetum cinerariifolium]
MQTQTSNTLYNAIMEAGGKDRPPMLALDKEVPIFEGSFVTTTETYMENYKNVSQDIRDQLNAEAEAVQIILTGIYSDIYSTVDACPNACEMWKAIKRLKQGESINVQDLETNLYWEFGKFTSRMFLLQLQPEWQKFVTLVKQSQELKTVSYHKLYDILKQHQHKVNEIRARRISRAANPLALVAQQQPVYHPQNHPNHYTQNFSTRSQHAATRNRGKAIVNSPRPIYVQEHSMIVEDDETSKDKEIDKLMALISLSFKKIYKSTKNNLRTSSNTSRANLDNSPRINRGTRYESQRIGRVAGARETVGTTMVQKSGIQCYNCKEFGHVARECQKPKRVKDASYHREKMLLYAADSGPIFDDEPLQKVSNNDHHNVFAIESEHPEQSKSVHDTYSIEQDEHNVIIDSVDMSYDREQIDQDDNDNDHDDDDDLANERELLASLIEKLKCKIDDSKNCNKFLETSNKVLVEKLKGEIEDFKNQNKSLESSNSRFKEANNKLSETNALMYNDLKKFKAELKRRNDVEYASKINDLNQMISEMKKKLSAHQEIISILSQVKEAQIKLYKTREDKELDKVIALKNKVKVLDNIVYKTGQSVQTMNMLNSKCRTSFAKPKFLKKAQRANPRLYDIGCYNDNLALMLAPESDDEVEDNRRNVKFSKNKTSVPACNDNLNAKTSNVKFVCATCGKCVLNEKHDMCVLKSHNNVNSRTTKPMVVPVSTREPKRIVNQSVAKPIRKIVALESNQKPRNITRELYEHLVEIILFIVDSECSKHMTGNLKLLTNFVEKFLGTVKFENDQIASIFGYGDLVQGVVTIKRVYCVEWLKHNLFSVGQFCDADLEVAFWKSTCYIRDLKGNDLLTGCTKFLNQTLHAYFDSEGIHHQTSVARTHEQNGVVERRNRTLVEAARTMLSVAKVPLFFWAEAIATTCFTQNRSLVIPRHEKTPYHIINDRKPFVKFFHIFGTICYIIRDGENLNKMKEKGDACIFIGYYTQSRAYSVFNKRTRVIVETIHVNFDELPEMASDHVSSDLAPQCQRMKLEHDSLSPGLQYQENVPHADRTVTTSNELDFLFSPMFDELLNGSTQVVSKSSAVNTADVRNHRQQHTNPLNTHITPEPTCQVLTQAPIVTSTENINQAETIVEYAHIENDEFINIFSTPDHPLEQVIGNPSQSVRIRRQLESDGEMCMFALTVSQTEPKNIKEAMVDSAWIESMQEELHQFDRLDEEVYVNQPDGFVDPYHPDKVYHLKKALYGLKQAPRAWGDILLVQTYVDDIIFGSMNPKLSKQFEKLMHNKFEMSMMGELKFFLGIQIHQSPRGIFINQAKYAQEILIKHALIYLTTSRPDIMHATCYCARYQAKPTEKHLTTVKRIFRYLKDTIHMGLWYPKDTGFELTAFLDSDHMGCLDSRKSTSGGIQFLGGDKLVSWSSKKQDCTSMYSAEADYVSLSACCAQVLWMRTQLTDYGFHFDKIPMYCDSKAAIAISCNPVQHSRTKHIDVRYHFIKEKVEKGIVELFFVGTEYQLADLFTKALPEEMFKYLVRRLGMRCLTPEELEVLANESA